LERVLARAEIEDLSLRYARGQDRCDAVLQRSVFHDDALCAYGDYEGGPDGFVDFAQSALARFASTVHYVGQVLLEFPEDDRAEGEVYGQAVHELRDEGTVRTLVVHGRYVDRYERRDGRWGIVFRQEVVDMCHLTEVKDATRLLGAMSRGGREQDPSYAVLPRKS